MNGEQNFQENRNENKNQTEKFTQKLKDNRLAIITGAVILIVVYLLAAQAQSWWPFESEAVMVTDRPETCGDFIVTARDRETGEVRDFSSDCDVPGGWDILSTEELAELGLTDGNNFPEQMPPEEHTEESGQASVAGTQSPEPPRTGAGEWLTVLLAAVTTLGYAYRRKLKTT